MSEPTRADLRDNPGTEHAAARTMMRLARDHTTEINRFGRGEMIAFDFIPRGLITTTQELDAIEGATWTTHDDDDGRACPACAPVDEQPGECTHRGAAICNRLELHDFHHDGYADNADAYVAGWDQSTIASAAINAAPLPVNDRVSAYYARPGSDRVAFQAGWIARQRYEIVERGNAPVVPTASARALFAAEWDARAVEFINRLGDAADHEACPYTLKASSGEIVDHLLRLIESGPESPEASRCAWPYLGQADRQTCPNCRHDLEVLDACPVCATYGAHDGPCYHAMPESIRTDLDAAEPGEFAPELIAALFAPIVPDIDDDPPAKRPTFHRGLSCAECALIYGQPFEPDQPAAR
jgi:hypothetical protein